MELSWTTFVLEIINFLVLLWILKRFLYRPILEVIDQRRKAIEEKLDDARHVRDEAQALKDQYRNRLAEWDREQRAARDALSREITEDRARRLAAVSDEIEQEKEKARIARERQLTDDRRAAEAQALLQGAEFSSRLLAGACGPDLEARLLDLLLRELDEVSDQRLARLREQSRQPPARIEVKSAFPLSAEYRSRLDTALHHLAGVQVPIDFSCDETLLAGLHVTIGAWVLAANVRDELRAFAELADVSA